MNKIGIIASGILLVVLLLVALPRYNEHRAHVQRLAASASADRTESKDFEKALTSIGDRGDVFVAAVGAVTKSTEGIPGLGIFQVESDRYKAFDVAAKRFQDGVHADIARLPDPAARKSALTAFDQRATSLHEATVGLVATMSALINNPFLAAGLTEANGREMGTAFGEKMSAMGFRIRDIRTVLHRQSGIAKARAQKDQREHDRAANMSFLEAIMKP